MTDPGLPPAAPPRALFLVALLAFAADVLIFYFAVTPLNSWSMRNFGTSAWGILAVYGLRAASAGIAAVALVHFRAATPADLGLAFRPIAEDLLWTLRAAGALLALSVLLMGVAVALLRILEPPLTGWPLELRTFDGFLPYALASIVAAPLVEEFVYRGLLTPALRSGYGHRGAILAGGLLFYVLHLVYDKPWWMAHYFVAGAILTWAFLKRGRLWICVVLHAGGNLLVITDDLILKYAPGVFKAIVGRLP
jgi:membrane protease YdiL (CAAX protease family)